MKIMLNT